MNRYDIDDDIQKEHGMINLDLMVINLYPFEETISGSNVNEVDAIENIDIGGPSMIRASAKNFYNKTILTDPDDYESFINELQNYDCSISEETRRNLAVKAFKRTAMYDSAIHNYFSEKIDEESIPEEIALALKKISSLRYGENPHQKAGLYLSHEQRDSLTLSLIHI